MITPASEILHYIKDMLPDMLPDILPLRVLEISGYDNAVGKLVHDYLKFTETASSPDLSYTNDRINLSYEDLLSSDGIYNDVYNSDYLLDIKKINNYDLILAFHLFENMVDTDAKALLVSLLGKVNKLVLVITPLYPYDLSSDEGFSNIRTYHPIFFLGMDFSYSCINDTTPVMQAYKFFPITQNEPMPCDVLPVVDITLAKVRRKYKIAYVLPNHFLTGCIKSMLFQMKEMTLRGHTVIAYFQSDEAKSVIPEWSQFTEENFCGQIVFPKGADPADYIKDVDIVFLGWMQQVPAFSGFNIPVVLWEQGSEYLFGDYHGLKDYEVNFREQMQYIFRAPVHLLAVSETVRAALKGRYNRESQLFPLAVDTDLYNPLDNKNNEVPIILLVGNPILKFKGLLDFAFPVLSKAGLKGLNFKVWWAMQTDVEGLENTSVFQKFVMPTQEKLAELYRSADILLSTSLYESFSLPPLEAMASGTAVIATDNGGINAFAKPGENCILCEQGDIDSVVAAIEYLISNPQARELLAIEGRKTALDFSFDKVADTLEECFDRILG